MGTPVVSRAGRTHVSRVGLSLLAQVGLTQLAVDSPERYVDLAIALATDPRRLKEIRTGLRQQMRQSSLTNAVHVTRQFEQALRSIWIEWCHGRQDAAE
jgi:predicted O-linked N-acetylglucosamine transferase (SPINDLY family)